MNDMLPITYDNIEALVASAFAKSRTSATAIREDVLHHLKPQHRSGPQRLLRAIDQRKIHTETVMREVEWLIDTITRQVQDGTTHIERYDSDESCISDHPVWTEKRRTEGADDLCRAIPVLLDFHETLMAVQDLLHAEKVVSGLRQTS